jgi:hypothetical protein
MHITPVTPCHHDGIDNTSQTTTSPHHRRTHHPQCAPHHRRSAQEPQLISFLKHLHNMSQPTTPAPPPSPSPPPQAPSYSVGATHLAPPWSQCGTTPCRDLHTIDNLHCSSTAPATSTTTTSSPTSTHCISTTTTPSLHHCSTTAGPEKTPHPR